MKVAGPRMHLIVAVSENMGIGKDNALPWRLKSEMKYFAQMTRTTLDPNKKESGCSLIICRRKEILQLFNVHCFSQLINLLKCMPESC
jgi:hypothetical protein